MAIVVRITHVITRLIIGGAQENTLATVLGLRREPGWEIRLISGPTHGPEGSLENQAAAVSGLLTIVPNLVRPLHPWHDLVGLCRLTALFRQSRPDIVHTHSGKAGFLGRLAAAKAGVPIIVHTIHGPSFGPFQSGPVNRFYRTAERIAGRKTTHFVAVADAMIQRYLAAGIGRADQYTRIFSGFHLPPFLAAKNDPLVRARWGLGPEDFVVGKIARLFKLKGHEDLFACAPEIVRQHPAAKFLLAGDGAWRKRFEQRVNEMRLQKHFIFTGLVAPEEIPALVGIMDVLVHLSRREGLPRALPQAMAAGKPVVAYDCDGAGEVCRDRQTGFLLPAGADLAQAVLALAANPGLRLELGQNGRNLARQHFAAEDMVDRIRQLYLRLSDSVGQHNRREPNEPR